MDNNLCFGWYDKGFPSKDIHNNADILSIGHKTECSVKQLNDKSISVKHSNPCKPMEKKKKEKDKIWNFYNYRWNIKLI